MCTTDRHELGLTDANCSCSSHAPAGDSAATSVDAGLATSTYEVMGMTCSHCVKSVTEEVGLIGGVRNIDVQLVTGGASLVTVSSAAPLDRAAVRAAIDEAGYQLVDTTR